MPTRVCPSRREWRKYSDGSHMGCSVLAIAPLACFVAPLIEESSNNYTQFPMPSPNTATHFSVCSFFWIGRRSCCKLWLWQAGWHFRSKSLPFSEVLDSFWNLQCSNGPWLVYCKWWQSLCKPLCTTFRGVTYSVHRVYLRLHHYSLSWYASRQIFSMPQCIVATIIIQG